LQAMPSLQGPAPRRIRRMEEFGVKGKAIAAGD